MPTLNIDPLQFIGSSGGAQSNSTSSGIESGGMGNGFLGFGSLEELLSSLEGPAKADLEAYIRQLFGENGGTIGQAVAAGRMTMDQARQMLLESGLSPAVVDNLIATNSLNMPLLTIPGDLETRIGPRGGQRALAGPWAIMGSMASQEVARRAAQIRPDILQRLGPALLQHDLGLRQIEAAGGGGGEGPPEPPRLPPLPPVPLPQQQPQKEGTPWWAALIPALGLAAPFGLEWYKNRQREKQALGPDLKKQDEKTQRFGGPENVPQPPQMPQPSMAPAWGKMPDVAPQGAQPGPWASNYQYPDYSNYSQPSPQYPGPSAPQQPGQYDWGTYTQPDWTGQYSQPDYSPPDYSWDQPSWDEPTPSYDWGDYL